MKEGQGEGGKESGESGEGDRGEREGGREEKDFMNKFRKKEQSIILI